MDRQSTKNEKEKPEMNTNKDCYLDMEIEEKIEIYLTGERR